MHFRFQRFGWGIWQDYMQLDWVIGLKKITPPVNNGMVPGVGLGIQ
jgi:hypothetical protein